jgi:MOSC domain-containing protein YiiM
MSHIEIKAIYISPDHDFRGHHGQPRGNNPILSVQEITCVAGRGIERDRYFDFKEDFKGQITFFDYDLFEKIRTQFNVPQLCGSEFRRNVMIQGCSLNGLIGKKFSVGECIFEGSEECAPCYWMDEAVCSGIEEFLKGQGGLRARIIEGGPLAVGKNILEIAE